MKTLKCEIPDMLMRRAIEFEKCMGKFHENATFEWGRNEAGYYGMFHIEDETLVASICISEEQTMIYADGIENYWHIPKKEKEKFVKVLWLAEEYNYLGIGVEEGVTEEADFYVNAKYCIPHNDKTNCTPEDYGLRVSTVLQLFMEELREFSEEMEYGYATFF